MPSTPLGRSGSRPGSFKEATCACTGSTLAIWRTDREGASALRGGNQANWQRIAEVLGHPEWLQDPRFRSGRDRLGHQRVLERLVTEALAAHPAGHWIELLDAAGVPVGSVNKEALEHDQSRAVSMVVEADHADGGTPRSLGLPIHFDGEAPYARSAAPRVGQ